MIERVMHCTKRPVVILGVTGTVGQRFVECLADHPWFDISAVTASERSVGRPVDEACRRLLQGELPGSVGRMTILPMDPAVIDVDDAVRPIAFSALPANVACDIEPAFAEAGYAVFSNASSFRYDEDVPLLIPEVNVDHAALLTSQRRRRGWSGFIVTNPNCTTTGIAMVLKPLDDAFGVRRVFATTMQAISGAGYPGTPSFDILDNVIPLIAGEEEKIGRELRLLLGEMQNDRVVEADIVVSAHANRVPVVDGHTICLSLGLERPVSPEEAVAMLAAFRGGDSVSRLPSAPERPIVVRIEDDRPQPRIDRSAGCGMTVSVGRIRRCPLLDLRMVVVVHNTVRGAAWGSVLNAEALVESGYVT